MKDKTMSQETTPSPATSPATRPGTDTQAAGMRDLAYRVKAAIDQEGAYSKSMQDMAAGYAAGTGTKPFVARQQIAEAFKTEFGASPYEYLGQSRAEMPAQKTVRRDRSPHTADLASAGR